RKKDFRDGFQEALRKAFKSVEKLHHKSEEPKTVIVQAVPAEENAALSEEEIEKAAEEVMAGVEAMTFSNGGSTYLLKETASGFDLFEKSGNKPFAKLVRSGRGDTYLYTSEKVNGNAFFDTSGNLVVEYLSDGQLVTLTYKKL
ncbi:MAG: hypothetical protein WBL27_11885, partial [Salinimicrobium sp.]